MLTLRIFIGRLTAICEGIGVPFLLLQLALGDRECPPKIPLRGSHPMGDLAKRLLV
jgi:hypothetical protein